MEGILAGIFASILLGIWSNLKGFLWVLWKAFDGHFGGDSGSIFSTANVFQSFSLSPCP
jgi:hypothetical protein